MVPQNSTRDRWNPDPFENKQQIQKQLNPCCIARLNTGGAQESGQEQESSKDAENTPPLLSSGKKHIRKHKAGGHESHETCHAEQNVHLPVKGHARRGADRINHENSHACLADAKNSKEQWPRKSAFD
jgi:hypothetical protein